MFATQNALYLYSIAASRAATREETFDSFRRDRGGGTLLCLHTGARGARTARGLTSRGVVS